MASAKKLSAVSKVYVVRYSCKTWDLEAVFYFWYFQSTKISLCPEHYWYGPKYSTSRVWSHANLYICLSWPQSLCSVFSEFSEAANSLIWGCIVSTLNSWIAVYTRLFIGLNFPRYTLLLERTRLFILQKKIVKKIQIHKNIFSQMLQARIGNEFFKIVTFFNWYLLFIYIDSVIPLM